MAEKLNKDGLVGGTLVDQKKHAELILKKRKEAAKPAAK